jgi:hypothetical protein
MAAGVGIADWVSARVCISIQRSWVAGVADGRVAGEDAAGLEVVPVGAQVDEAGLGIVLLAGEAVGGLHAAAGAAAGRVGRPRGCAPPLGVRPLYWVRRLLSTLKPSNRQVGRPKSVGYAMSVVGRSSANLPVIG